jgi:hypothetical protein
MAGTASGDDGGRRLQKNVLRGMLTWCVGGMVPMQHRSSLSAGEWPGGQIAGGWGADGSLNACKACVPSDAWAVDSGRAILMV